MCGGIGQKRHVARILQRYRQSALMLGARARLAAWLDLGTLRNVAAQAANILIVDLAHVVDTERADLAARAEITATAAKSRSTATLWAV